MENNYEATKLFLLFSILISSPILSESIDHNEDKHDENRVKNSISSSWAKIKSLLHETQMKLYPPNLDFRSPKESITEDEIESEGASTREKVNKRVKMAVGKSMEDGEITLEETAQTAAKLMGDALHTAKHKVEDKISKVHDHNNDNEQEL